MFPFGHHHRSHRRFQQSVAPVGQGLGGEKVVHGRHPAAVPFICRCSIRKQASHHHCSCTANHHEDLWAGGEPGKPSHHHEMASLEPGGSQYSDLDLRPKTRVASSGRATSTFGPRRQMRCAQVRRIRAFATPTSNGILEAIGRPSHRLAWPHRGPVARDWRSFSDSGHEPLLVLVRITRARSRIL